MKHFFLSLLLIVLFIFNTNAQTVRFVGMTSAGGATDGGTIFETDAYGNFETVLHSFISDPGRRPYGKLLEASNGKLYGLTTQGGAKGYGVIYEYDPATGERTKKVDFTEKTGTSPTFYLIQATNGKLYGVTTTDGQYGSGTIYEYDLLLDTLIVRHHFNPSVGSRPIGNLVQHSNGKLYGTTLNGGFNNIGILYEFDPVTYNLTPKLDLDITATGIAASGMILATNGKIYGSMLEGGDNNAGVIFEYLPTSNTFTKLFDFDRMLNGLYPNILMEAGNGFLYSTTKLGGVNDQGVLFSYDIANDTVFKLLDFDADVYGYYPIGELLQLSNGKIYGVSNGITGNYDGQLFEYDHVLDTISRVFPFNSSIHGYSPNAGLTLAGGKVFGTTNSGGSQNMGTLFEFDPINDTIIKKHDFTNSEGWKPYGNLTLASDGNYYGTTVNGGNLAGNIEMGNIFNYNANSNTYTKLLDFGGSGKSPSAVGVKGSLLEASNGKLYGLYPLYGYLYKYDTAIDTITHSLDFRGSVKSKIPRGANPIEGNLVEATNGKLYGMYPLGGANNAGYIYEYDTALDTITNTVDFDFIAGGKVNINPYPEGTLIEATNGKLYGMTKYGGTGLGSLFEYDISADTIKEKINFDGNNGLYPKGDLVEASNGKLYGMTPEGGANGFGVLFEYDTIGTLIKKIDFDSVNTGAYPHGSLIVGYNGKLYGMTSGGGANGLGVIFEYDTNGVLTKLMDFNGVNGATPYGSLLQVGYCESYSSISPVACDSFVSPSGKIWKSANTYLDTLHGANRLGCDSIITINLTINNPTASTETITACDSYSWHGNIFTSSGTYLDTIPNVAGCDSLMTLNLTINNSNSGSETVTACNSYTWPANNTTYTSSGVYTAVLTNANGCDSTATLNLIINNATTSTETVTACDSYMWLGNTFTASGTYLDTIPNASGCDSLMTLNLTINNSSSGNETVTTCNSFTWSANNTTYTSSGTYTTVLTNVNGCDSTATLNLTINNTTTSTEAVTACDTYSWLGNTFTSSGTYLDTIPNAAGCDSIVTLNLTINNSSSGSENVTACNSFTWSANNTTYTSSGVYTVVLTNVNGCDSTATLNLTINSSTTSTETVTACDSYVWLGNAFTSSGTYFDTIPNAAGCDSIMTLNLTITNSTTSTQTVTACDSYSWLGNTFTASGTYLDTIPNAAGCDSIMTLNLSINNSSSGSESVTACGSYNWSANNTTYTASGSYTAVLTNANGCDSTSTLNLTINNATTSIETVTACDSYLWLGNTFTASGTYLDTIPNVAGCDSIMTLNLTINNSSSGSESVTACGSYNWSANNTTYTSSGTYTAVLTNVNGCDSTATLNLTINNFSTSTETVTACNSYSWLGNTFTASGTYLDTIPNAAGCDSLMTLNLTINQSSSGSETITACNSFTWSANNITYTSSGTYTTVLTNANGCDSTATLNLTINNATTSTQTVSACDSYTWLGNTLTSSGTYNDTIPNAAGCDSIMTLKLTINNATTSTETITVCDSYSWLGNTFTASGTYLDTIPNAAGCDSLMTLNLTINNSSSGSEAVTACNSYSWMGKTYTASGTYLDTISNSVGCDSTLTLNLTIKQNSSEVIFVNTCGSYTSPSGKYNWTTTGTYMDTIQNALGCDSVLTFGLVINPNSTSTINPTACNSYTSPSGKYSWSVSGNYVDTFPSINGCDSIININLTIETVDTSTTLNGTTITSNESGAIYQWVDCNNGNAPISGETDSSFTATSNGSYAVIVTKNSCTMTSACVNITSVGIEEKISDNNLKLYPNPTAGLVYLEVSELLIEEIRVYNILGEKINVPIGRHTIDLGNQSRGIYFISVETDQGTVTKKIVKSH